MKILYKLYMLFWLQLKATIETKTKQQMGPEMQTNETDGSEMKPNETDGSEIEAHETKRKQQMDQKWNES